MPGPVSLVRRLLVRLLGVGPEAQRAEELQTVLDGASAAAVLEVSVGDGAGLAPTFGGSPGAELYRREAARLSGNLLGDRPTGVDATDARAALSTAVGLSMAGLRASAFATGPQLASAQDQLAVAAGRHLPLVVHLSCSSVGGQGVVLGGSHAAYHAISDAGAMQLFASTVQEVVDLALVGRLAGELALLPVVIAMDGETARAVQDVKLPTAQLVRELLGAASDQLPVDDEALRLVFGASRRRVVRFHDLERPVLLGAALDGAAFGSGAAASRVYLDERASTCLSTAFDKLHAKTGRRLGPLSTHATDDARVIIVTQGVAAETAAAVADELRASKKTKVGVVAVRCLRPFPRAGLAALLTGRDRVVVLERTHAPLSGDAPLLREVRAALRGASQFPLFTSALWGIGGESLSGADLAGLLQEPRRELAYLGVDFLPAKSTLPMRQAQLDTLRRTHPEVAALGYQSTGPAPAPAAGAISIVVCRHAGQGADAVAATLGGLLHGSLGGQLRCSSEGGWEAWGTARRDRVIQGAAPLREPGDDAATDLLLLAQPFSAADPAALPRLRAGGAVVVESPLGGEALWRALPAGVRSAVRAGASLHVTASRAGEPAQLREERLLGALLGALLKRPGTEIKERKLGSLRTEALEDRPEEERIARVAALQAGLSSLVTVDCTSLPEVPREARVEPQAPLSLQRLSRAGGAEPTYDSLPRFRAQVGALLDRHEPLTPDPCLATGAIPSLSALFREPPAGLQMFPAFEPGACTGCGACWVACPEGAIAPVALTTQALLEAGLAIAKERGVRADALSPLVGKLAARVNVGFKAATRAPERLRPLLDAAFAEVVGKAGLPEERRAAVDAAWPTVADAIGELTAAKAAPYFDEPEGREKGKGELLALSVNPTTCKGCGLCVAACAPGALQRAADEAPLRASSLAAYRLWEALPDTPGGTIARLREHPDVGPLAAVLLSRHALLAMSGGDGMEPASGGKSALRLALATGEFELQRRVAERLKSLDELRAQLAERIRALLSAALPAADLAALSGALQDLGGGAVDLAAVCEKAGAQKVDGTKVARLAQLGRELAEQRARIALGTNGLGKARLGMVLAPGELVRGLATFPDNPFQAAVVVDSTGEGAALARGLLEGQLRQAVAELALVRLARLELQNPTEAALREGELRRLTRDELTADERRLLPPMVLVGEAASFSERSLSSLLDTDLPLKVLLLADADGGLSAHGLGGAEGSALEFLAPAHRGAYVAQSSLAHPWHLARGLSAAFQHDGPAVVRIHAPSPTLHGFAPELALEQARLAVVSRAFPLFTLDPAAPGVFGTRLSLEQNPALTSGWVEEGAGPVTPAHWALTEGRFASHLQRLKDGAQGGTALAAYLLLAPQERRGKTPYVEDGAGARFTPDATLVALCDRRLGEWQTLQELAGVLTPFTAAVRAAAEAAVAAAHREAISRLEHEHEARIEGLTAEIRADAARRVRDRLLELAGHRPAASKPEERS